MSLSKLGFNMLQDVYKNFNIITVGTGLSYLASRYIQQLKLEPFAMTKYTAVVGIAVCVAGRFIDDMEPSNKDQNYFSRGVVLCAGLYGLYTYASPEKKLESFAKITGFALASGFSGLVFIDLFKRAIKTLSERM